ncbi:hypothetical protein BH11BAC5_BH11BAC5_45950 [soil metagenome]
MVTALYFKVKFILKPTCFSSMQKGWVRLASAKMLTETKQQIKWLYNLRNRSHILLGLNCINYISLNLVL